MKRSENLEDVMRDTMSPQRRTFIQKGALVAAAAATLPILGSGLAGCSEDTTTPTDETKARQVSLVTDAYLIEMLAVNTYVKAIATGTLTGANLEYAVAFQSHHAAHAAKLKSIITGELAAAAPTDPAASVTFETGVLVGTDTKFKYPPVFGSLTTFGGILKYAVAMEIFIAQSHFNYATSTDSAKRLTSLVARAAVSDMAPIAAQHATAWRYALKMESGIETDVDAGIDEPASVLPTTALSQETPRW